MANVKVTWVLPVTRESGKPLSVADIAGVEIQLSANGGQNYATLDSYPPNVLEMIQTDLEPGEWFFRGIVHDKDGKASEPLAKSILIPDHTAPSTLLSLNLSL